jgi:hypothetical protein
MATAEQQGRSDRLEGGGGDGDADHQGKERTSDMIDMIKAPIATPSAIAANLLAVLEASLAERAISICSALDAASFCASHLMAAPR